MISDSPGLQHAEKSICQIVSEVCRDSGIPVFYKLYEAWADLDRVGEKMNAFSLFSAVRHVRETWSVFMIDSCFSCL